MTVIALAAAVLMGQDTTPRSYKSISEWPTSVARPAQSGERHLKNIRQVTFGGQNAEGYWNMDGSKITFQTRQPEYPDEQIFVMDADGSNRHLVSTGLGRCTCSYFSPDGKWVYFSSTHEKDKGAQAPVDMSKGYVWKVNPAFSLYRARPDGTGLQKVLDLGDYVAETTIDPSGKYMVWTAKQDGDVDIFRSNLDGTDPVRLVNWLGYDGGPFVSWDGSQIVFRSSPRMTKLADIRNFQSLLKDHLVRPSSMNVWVMDADGANKRQVTRLPGASFAPFMHPDGKRIVFCSNYEDPRGREFNLYIVNTDGTGLERVTSAPDFDGFPMFSKDGKKIVFASNRFGSVPAETNLFIADWVD